MEKHTLFLRRELTALQQFIKEKGLSPPVDTTNTIGTGLGSLSANNIHNGTSLSAGSSQKKLSPIISANNAIKSLSAGNINSNHNHNQESNPVLNAPRVEHKPFFAPPKMKMPVAENPALTAPRVGSNANTLSSLSPKKLPPVSN